MLSPIRTKPRTRAYAEGYDKIDWSKGEEKKPAKRRAVKAKAGGGWECGIRVHDHATFAEACYCVSKKKGKKP